MTDHHRLLEAARHHRWVLTANDLHRLGLTDVAIRYRVRTGALHRLHVGVFAVGRPELAPEGRWLAATRACPGSVLSHHSAAALFGLVPAGAGPAHVTVPTQIGRQRRKGITIHRCESLVPEVMTWRSGIPVTTLDRVLRDLAGVLAPNSLTRAVRQAEVLHRLDLAVLHRKLELAPPNAARERRLLKVLDRYVPGEVGLGLEEAMLGVCVRADVPIPVTQHPAGRFIIDFAWPDLMLAVETDDRFSHDTATAFREDRVKDRELRAGGWYVMRFTYAEVTQDGAAVGREIRAAIARQQARE